MIKLEEYQCDGCRGLLLHCGECPHNEDRKREYKRKYESSQQNDLTHRNGYGLNISD